MRQVAQFQQLTAENELQFSNVSKRGDAQGGHSFGHSAEALMPLDKTVLRDVIAAYEEGKRAEEIRELYPSFRLWQIYAAVAVYLKARESGSE